MLSRYSVVRLPKMACAGCGTATPTAPPNIRTPVARAVARRLHRALARDAWNLKRASQVRDCILVLLKADDLGGPYHGRIGPSSVLALRTDLSRPGACPPAPRAPPGTGAPGRPGDRPRRGDGSRSPGRAGG